MKYIISRITLWIRGGLGNLHPDTRDAIKGLMVLVFIVIIVIGCTVAVTLELNERATVKTLCKEHGHLDAIWKFGEWVCCGFEDGRVVYVLLSKVVDGNKVP